MTLENLHGWDAPWRGLRVVVTGLGKSGFSAADTLAELGARVIVVDGRDSEENRMNAQTLGIVGVEDVRLGAEHTQSLPDFQSDPVQLVVTSPGWRPDSPVVAAATEAGVPVWSDVQLARRLGARPGATDPQWLVLTGTNGKTTTVGLLESMLRADGRRAVACGNNGFPILDAIRDPQGYDVLAVELSSFQLHYSEPLGAEAAAVLNLADDHADWHGGAEQYRAAKAKIYEGTRIACVFNAEDLATERMVEAADVTEGCRAIGFTTDSPRVSEVGVVDQLFVDRAFLEQRRTQALELGAREDLGPVAPRHLVANVLAAAALARAVDVAPESIQQAIANYQPAEHRIQPVAKADDVLWINDTKATNPHAALASLTSFTDVVWIAGGLPKGVDYEALVAAVAPRLRAVVLIGTDSSQLLSSLERHAPGVPVIGGAVRDDESQREAALRGTDGAVAMTEAVAQADQLAEPGCTVLLAPAAASMDQFSSYTARGDAFIAAVAELMHGRGFTTD